MPRTITLLAALALIGAAAVLGRDSIALAGPGGPVQDFTVETAICYGAAPADSLVCPGSSATEAPVSSGAAMHTIAHIERGSRLGAPIIFTPGSFPFTPGTVGATVGEVTAQLDILCDGVADVVSGGTDPGDPVGSSGSEGPTEPWPDPAVWRPFPVKHIGTAPAGADAYVNAIKPTPPTFMPLSYDRADIYSLWFGKSTPVYLPTISNGDTTPLNSVIEEYPPSYGAPAGLRVSLSLFLGNYDTPTNSFLSCLDSAQDSVQSSTQTMTPSVPGLYPRWATWISEPDHRGGNVSRVIDLMCVNVGNFASVDVDGDCLPDSVDPDDTVADADGDMLVDGIEAAFGTDRLVADADGDGATDFDEMFQFTNPGVADTDGDGSLDKQDTGADENAATALVDDTPADDNCPAIANPSQANADYANDYNGLAGGDPTNPSQDPYGDACDFDDDNDRMADTVEAGLYILPMSGANTTGWCKPNADNGAVFSPTNTTNPDTDGDLGLDGVECKFDSNPQDFNSRMVVTPGDNLADGDAETFYRTQKISKPGGGVEDNPDGDGFLTGDADSDSDNDRLIDGLEVKFYGTHPANDDSDGDGCLDGKEAASVNGDRTVSAIDLSQVAQRFGPYTPSLEGTLTPAGRVNYDYTKDRTISATDLSQVAANFGACGVQLGITPSNARQ